MKLDKIEKIIIAVLAVIVINAIGMNYYEHQKFIHNRDGVSGRFCLTNEEKLVLGLLCPAATGSCYVAQAGLKLMILVS